MQSRKLKSILYWLAGLVAAVLFLCGIPLQAQASPIYAKYKIWQTSAGKNSATINWPASTASGYNFNFYRIGVQNLSDNDPNSLWEYYDTKDTQYTFSNLNPCSKYEVVVSVIDTDYYSYDRAKGYMFTVPGKVENVHGASWSASGYMKAAWQSNNAMQGYQYTILKENGKKKASGYTDSTSVRITNKDYKHTYSIKVRGFITLDGGKKVFGPWSQQKYLSAGPQLTAASLKKGKLTVRWKPVKGASSYSVYIDNSKHKSVKVKTVSAKKTSAAIKKFEGKKLTSKKEYCVYVTANMKKGRNKYMSQVYNCAYVRANTKAQISSTIYIDPWD